MTWFKRIQPKYPPVPVDHRRCPPPRGSSPVHPEAALIATKQRIEPDGLHDAPILASNITPRRAAFHGWSRRFGSRAAISNQAPFRRKPNSVWTWAPGMNPILPYEIHHFVATALPAVHRMGDRIRAPTAGRPLSTTQQSGGRGSDGVAPRQGPSGGFPDRPGMCDRDCL